MKVNEVKWATGGLAGGFLLYLLVGTFRSQPAVSPLLAKAPGAAWLPVPAMSVVQVTNLELPELRIESPPRWVGLGLPSLGVLNSGYSLDLIDTHFQLPQKPEEP